MTLHKFLSDLFTGPDGVTIAYGRCAALPFGVAGLALPFVAILHGQAVDLAAAGALYGATCAGITALVGLTNHTEPKATP